jgi:hypothetical protein
MTRLRRPLPRALGLVLAILLAVVGLAVVGVLAWGLVLAFQEEGGGGPVAVASPSAVPATTPAEARQYMDEALARLAADDRSGYRAAFAVRGRQAENVRDALWTDLDGLPWKGLHANVVAVPGKRDVFDIKILGRIDGSGPPDRIVAERVLTVRRVAGVPTVTDDRTPPAVAREYLSALDELTYRSGPGFLIVYDKGNADIAGDVYNAMNQARAAVGATLGSTASRPILVVLYDSRRQAADYLGLLEADKKLNYFEHEPATLSEHPWVPGDIGVVTAELTPGDPWTGQMLTHEVTHALTEDWFADTDHAPLLFAEGLAVAVAGDRSYGPVRQEIATGNRRLPLIDLFAFNDFWSGNSRSRTTLAYLESGAVVSYVLDRWGVRTLRRFAVDVAASDLSEKAVRKAARRDLGVSWDEFYAGWKAYVQTLP